MMLGQLAKNDLINQSNFLVFRKNSKYTVKNEEYIVRNNSTDIQGFIFIY